jgi:hypothetical protein
LRAAHQKLGENSKIEFKKWIALECDNDSGTQRGASKIFASNWHNKPKFDTVRLNAGEYLLLKGLCVFNSRVYGVGVQPENCDLRILPYHYRWPTLLFRKESPLVVEELKLSSVHPVMCFDDMRNDHEFRDAVGAHPGDRIVFHNIFVTHGELRNPWELEDWCAGGNGNEVWGN